MAQPALRWAANLYVELSNLFNFTGRRFPTECPPSRRKVHQSGGIRTTPTAYAPSRRKLHHPDGIRSTFGIKARRNSDQYKVTFGVVAVGSSGQQGVQKRLACWHHGHSQGRVTAQDHGLKCIYFGFWVLPIMPFLQTADQKRTSPERWGRTDAPFPGPTSHGAESKRVFVLYA